MIVSSNNFLATLLSNFMFLKLIIIFLFCFCVYLLVFIIFLFLLLMFLSFSLPEVFFSKFNDLLINMFFMHFFDRQYYILHDAESNTLLEENTENCCTNTFYNRLPKSQAALRGLSSPIKNTNILKPTYNSLQGTTLT